MSKQNSLLLLNYVYTAILVNVEMSANILLGEINNNISSDTEFASEIMDL